MAINFEYTCWGPTPEIIRVLHNMRLPPKLSVLLQKSECVAYVVRKLLPQPREHSARIYLPDAKPLVQVTMAGKEIDPIDRVSVRHIDVV
eukprot:46968-Eustigmatos_ZCMA.PRE.1